MRVTLSLLLSVMFCAIGCARSPVPDLAPHRPLEVIEFRSQDVEYHLRLPADGWHGSISRDNSHTGIVVVECSDSGWFCLTGGIQSFVAPKTCDREISTGWRVGEVSAKLIYADDGLYYFGSLNSEAARELGAEIDAGFVYSSERGVVGLWFSPEPVIEAADVRALTIHWIVGNKAFMKCGAQNVTAELPKTP